MVIIKTTCPTCGEVDLTADRVELRIAIGGSGSSYAFDCPRCCERIRKPADIARKARTRHLETALPGVR